MPLSEYATNLHTILDMLAEMAAAAEIIWCTTTPAPAPHTIKQGAILRLTSRLILTSSSPNPHPSLRDTIKP